eukprot:3935150-Rhodomonas_salina.1
MMLRRQGMRPFNHAPLAASAGHDFGLRRKDVEKHGYVYDQELFDKYNRRWIGSPAASVSVKEDPTGAQ